jgi:hypothetical protein
VPETEEPGQSGEFWPGDEEELDEIRTRADRSGLTDADLEPRPPSRLARRLSFLSGAEVVGIILVLLLVVPLVLAVVLSPLISFLSR